jgi:hypothetical protein
VRAAEQAAESVREWINCADRRHIMGEETATRRDLAEAMALATTVDDWLRIASSWTPISLPDADSALGAAERVARTSQEWISIALFRHNYGWLSSHSPNPKAPPWSFPAQSVLAAAIRSSTDQAEGAASGPDDWLACATAWDWLLAPCTNTVQGFVKGFLGDRDAEVDRCLASAKSLAVTEAEKEQCRRADVDLFPMREARRRWRAQHAKGSDTSGPATDGEAGVSKTPNE